MFGLTTNALLYFVFISILYVLNARSLKLFLVVLSIIFVIMLNIIITLLLIPLFIIEPLSFFVFGVLS